MLKSKAQTFNDGIVRIYSVGSAEELILEQTLRYKERTVGLSRYYTALQANVKVQYVLRCPLHRSVSSQHIAVPNDGKQYKIVQVQYPEDADPPAMDLTLEEVKAKYDIT